MARVFGSALVALVAFSLAPHAAAQGVQTGTVSGVVRDVTGAVIAQATIHADSPALQGSRMTLTDPAGAYVFRGLPTGDYTIRIEFAGFQTVSSRVRVGVGAVERLNATLQPAVNEAVTVTAPTPSLLTARAGGSQLRTAEIDRLPTGRTPSLVAELAPGLTNNTPNVNQVTISGAVAYDNVFLLDGVDIGDNLFARPDDLFVEDAIDETRVLTAAISAEFGRFSGGVVNAVTKRGGDLFSGSI
ncbi:MAG TPA: carboxypeptidase regulatory-like domain-containing protein, partial [Vicinamibacterales bacterium]|nr:carboxypeptidase regulatory-like domain-containing protein [Vicinamibacterales bacterium]